MERSTKIVVTGANGFIGKNLIVELKNSGYKNVFSVDIETTKEDIETYLESCEFIFHLAGVNRPKNDSEFITGNLDFTSKIINILDRKKNKPRILMPSSIQAEKNNSYGNSKRMAEDTLKKYEKENNVEVIIYRLSNAFGKWSKPNYNTVVATFCHNIARDLEININDPNAVLNLCYIDDIIEEFIYHLENQVKERKEFYSIQKTENISLGELASIIRSFSSSRKDLSIPNVSKDLVKKLYSTYTSFLPEDKFSYLLNMNVDNRGSFTEFLRTENSGQISVNISKPGIVKGNHYHHTKVEKFLVVSGKGVIRFRKIDAEEIIEYFVSGEKLEVIDIPVGYTHSIENIGESDMVTIMWVNECFDKERPDTFYLPIGDKV